MTLPSSPLARIAGPLLMSLALLSPRVACAQKLEVAKDLPAKERQRLQLAVDAMTKDRPKKDYAGAQTKLKKALAACRADHCSAADQAQIEFFLGIVQAEGGEELFVRRDSVQIKGEGLIGLGRVPERDSPLTIRFYCEEA
jgi:hypothetical protein